MSDVRRVPKAVGCFVVKHVLILHALLREISEFKL